MQLERSERKKKIFFLSTCNYYTPPSNLSGYLYVRIIRPNGRAVAGLCRKQTVGREFRIFQKHLATGQE